MIAALSALAIGAGSWLAGLKTVNAASKNITATVRTAHTTESPSITGQIFGIAGRCLDNTGGGVANGNPITLVTCNGSQQQEWTLNGDGTIRVQGRCLGANLASANSPGPVGLYACNGAATELWTITSHTILSASSGLCLADWQDKTTNGNPVWLNTCQGGAGEVWISPSLAIDPSGLAMPVGNIPGWRQVFADDFSEEVPLGQFPAAVSKKWTDYPDGWPDTTHNGTYEPTKVVSIHGGIMDLYLHTQDGIHMVAAPVPIIPGAPGKLGGMVYGRYEVRFRAQPVAGYKTAWLLWPDSNNQSQGEIDFPEGSLNSTIDAFMHHRGDPKAQDYFLTSFTYADWHTAIIEWTAKSVTFILDGKVIGVSSNKSVIPDVPMHWVLQTETRLTGGPPSNSATSNVEIDWVVVYVPQGSASIHRSDSGVSGRVNVKGAL